MFFILLNFPDKAIQAIEEVLKNPQQHIEKQKNILTAYTQITWEDVANNYINLFKLIILLYFLLKILPNKKMFHVEHFILI